MMMLLYSFLAGAHARRRVLCLLSWAEASGSLLHPVHSQSTGPFIWGGG